MPGKKCWCTAQLLADGRCSDRNCKPEYRRPHRRIEQTATARASRLGIAPSVLFSRISARWDKDDAETTPLRDLNQNNAKKRVTAAMTALARALRSEGSSFAEIGRQLGVTGKTAKKAATS